MNDIVDMSAIQRKIAADLCDAIETEKFKIAEKVSGLLQQQGFSSIQATALLWPVMFANPKEADRLIEFIQQLRMPPDSPIEPAARRRRAK